ncbi:helix-turn-helix domain-containing protein [Georgenia subflava]|uniref:TetR family transcriptional regulator n=1 Tax=Georgenia subflava TaxID=1622177 RepID=A0A6N7EFG4_9MICO|nr:helix-turn-helix domain-containing protein [Georgenia subflava]MPV35688.1 TetR family transcriptional regulator [Georgenia subflava]
MARLPAPISRQDRQRQTREALVFAARAVFARDGYHGARLDVIAREAGFSKGAVYSNFTGKAALFLEVMDANLQAASADGGWDVFESSPQGGAGAVPTEEIQEAVKGFALATLEFIATAARDVDLAAQLQTRMQALAAGYAAVAAQSRPESETMPPEEVGALLTALDQGAALLTLSGSTAIDQRVLRTGMRRLLDPARAAEEPEADGDDEPALHDRVIRERIAATVREWPTSSTP